MPREDLVHALTSHDPVRLGPFRILGRLGAGGMGVVYAGQDSTGRRAAIKVIQPQLAHDPVFRKRFAREVVLLARVEGVCTARVMAADVEHEPPYLALEYVEGPTLAEYVDEHGRLPDSLLLPLALGLAEGLEAVHAVGVVHRDLKPANIVLGAKGPKVIDFGVAHLVDATSLTTSGLVVGSPGWMAPEQFATDVVTPASDVFSWASCVYYAALGRMPFGGGSVEAVYYRILNADPDLSDIPDPLRSLLGAAFRKAPEERLTVPELLDALAGDQAGQDPAGLTTALLRESWTFRPETQEVWPPFVPVGSTAVTAAYQGDTAVTALRLQPVARRPPRWAVALMLALTLAALAIIYAAAQNKQDQPTPLPAAQRSTSASPAPSKAAPSQAAKVTQPPTPRPPYYANNPVCAEQRCSLLAAQGGVKTRRGVLRVELIGLPIPDGGEDPTQRPVYVALYDAKGSLIYTTPEPMIGAYDAATPTYPDGGMTTDRAGRIFIPFGVGAHSGQLIVLDPNGSSIQDFGSLPGPNGDRFMSSSPGAAGRDLDGDGINEVVLPSNDCEPSCAEGAHYERYYGYEGGDWVLLGCSKLDPTPPYQAGPRIPAGGPNCER